MERRTCIRSKHWTSFRYGVSFEVSGGVRQNAAVPPIRLHWTVALFPFFPFLSLLTVSLMIRLVPLDKNKEKSQNSSTKEQSGWQRLAHQAQGARSEG